jgi:peptidyl-prolyl cis-trans isomerase D
MLNALRAFAKSWVGWLFAGICIVGLAGFGITNVITSLGSNTVARVGDTDISAREFSRAYNVQLNAAAQQLGMLPTPEQALAFGIPSSVLARLASDAALNALGERFGLGVSDAQLGRMLREDPSFQGVLGRFERENFVQVLAQNGLTEAEYFDIQTKAARREQIASSMFTDATVPQASQELFARYLGDRRTVDYLVVSAFNVPTPPAPTDEQLAAYLTEHQADFRTVEMRTVDILDLSPETLAASQTVTDEEIAAEYERTRATLNTPEQRTIRQVALATPELVAAFETGKAEGKSFDTLLTENNLAATDLGTLSAEQVGDQALSTAAFGLTVNDFVIVPGAAGQRAVTVTAITPANELSLEDARDTIRNTLAVQKARNGYAETLDQVEELRAALQPLPQIAERFGLTTTELVVSDSGAELSAIPGIADTDRPEVTEAIFAAEQDRLTPAVSLTNNHSVFVSLKLIEPARDRTLDEARDDVTAAWTLEQTDNAITKEVENIKAELAAGSTLSDVALARGQFPQLSQPMGRDGDGTNVLNAQVADAIFAGGPNHFGSAVNGDGDQVVFQVVDILAAEPTLNEEQSGLVADAARDSLFGEFSAALREDAGVRINQQVLNQLLSLDATSGL